MRGSRWGGDQSDRPRRGRWSQAEIARLKEMYGLKSDEYIAKELHRPAASVRKMAETIFSEATRTGPWKQAELDKLKMYLGICDVEIIARIFSRNIADVQAQILSFDKLQTDGPWSQEEIADLKRLYGTRTDRDIARVFGRSEESVAKQAIDLCLAKDKAFVRRVSGEEATTRMPRWTPEEIATLEEMYAEHSNLEIAQALNRSVKSVVSKAHIIGLKKDPKRLQDMGRQNVSLRYSRQAEKSEDEPKSMKAGAEQDSGSSERDAKHARPTEQQHKGPEAVRGDSPSAAPSSTDSGSTASPDSSSSESESEGDAENSGEQPKSNP